MVMHNKDAPESESAATTITENETVVGSITEKESVRVSRRLEMKRQTRKKKGKLVKIKLEQVIITL